nr:MAG TPA: hypothetical protein [Caudoviricetes sp.]
MFVVFVIIYVFTYSLHRQEIYLYVIYKIYNLLIVIL